MDPWHKNMLWAHDANDLKTCVASMWYEYTDWVTILLIWAFMTCAELWHDWSFRITIKTQIFFTRFRDIKKAPYYHSCVKWSWINRLIYTSIPQFWIVIFVCQMYYEFKLQHSTSFSHQHSLTFSSKTKENINDKNKKTWIQQKACAFLWAILLL